MVVFPQGLELSREGLSYHHEMHTCFPRRIPNWSQKKHDYSTNPQTPTTTTGLEMKLCNNRRRDNHL